jgi:hypothetical protein
MSQDDKDKIVEYLADCKCYRIRIGAWHNKKRKNTMIIFSEPPTGNESTDVDAALLFSILWCCLPANTYHKLLEYMQGNQGNRASAKRTIQEILKRHKIEDDFFLNEEV